MMRLLRWVIVRRLLGEPLRTSWTILGVALGVAVFVGIRLASQSAMSSFANTVDAVAGRANLQVTGESGPLDERVFAQVARQPGVIAAAPAVQVYVRARAGSPRAALLDTAATQRQRWPETLMLLGLDVLREAPFARVREPAGGAQLAGATLLTDPRAVAIAGSLARRTGLRAGDTLTVLASGRPEALVVREVMDSEDLDRATGGNVIVTDIATAQEVLGRYGVIDRIDLVVEPSRREAVRAELSRALPPGTRAELPASRTRQVENMVRAFRLNISALSFIALFVSATLIFNALALSVLGLRREIGMLRSLGVTRGQIRALFLGEGLAIGLVGAGLGLVFGTLFAQGALGAVSRTLTDLYGVRQTATVTPDLGIYLSGLAIGIGVALASALLPAWEASSTPPGVTMRQGLFIEAQPLPVVAWALWGLSALAVAALTVLWAVRVRQPYGGFAAAFLVLAGFALLAPIVTRVLERAAEPWVRRLGGIESLLGMRYLRAALARASVVIAAVAVAVGMTVSLTLMVGSFRRTVDTWITQSIRGDLYVEPFGHRETAGATSLPDSLLAAVRALPEVRGVDTFRAERIVVGDRPAQAIGVDFAVQREFGALQFTNGTAPELLGRALEHGEVVVTESFAYHFRLAQGDTLRLNVPAGEARLRVAGVIYDYATDAGVVYMDRGLFARLWRDSRTESVALYLAPGADAVAVRSKLLALAGPDLMLGVTPNRALREGALKVFDQTFQITWALQGIAILVSVLGVIGTLTALIMQRGRELAVLRAIGARRAQVQKMVVTESIAIGAIGSLLGCVCGVCLALILVYVINRQFFGWTIRFSLDPWLFVQAIAVVVVTAALAGLVPARLAVQRVAPEAMRIE